MDFNRYCRSCGHHVEINFQKFTAYCPICDKELTQADVIQGYRRDIRVRQLKAMHELMREANDENIYYTWVYTMPDEPGEDDFKAIAMDDKAYNECFDAFTRLIAKEGNRW
jgi:hypothetical protein